MTNNQMAKTDPAIYDNRQPQIKAMKIPSHQQNDYEQEPQRPPLTINHKLVFICVLQPKSDKYLTL